MNFSEAFLLNLSIVLAVSMAMLAVLNWVFRKHGGTAKGWAGAVFIGICWIAALVFIIKKLS
jgi:hypothetical protein